MLGYVYQSRPAGVSAVPVYRCIQGSGEHFDSNSAGCEGHRTESLLGYTINQAPWPRYISLTSGDHLSLTSRVPSEYQFEGSLGMLFKQQVTGTRALYECRAGGDHFTSPDRGCEGQTYIALLGYVYQSRPAGVSAVPVYRCIQGSGEHFDSNSAGCEGHRTESLLGYTIDGRLPPRDRTPPRTVIAAGPVGVVAPGAQVFRFTSSERGSSFQCRWDGGVWAGCGSPVTRTMRVGRHTFAVRARDKAGNLDLTPASRSFTVATRLVVHATAIRRASKMKIDVDPNWASGNYTVIVSRRTLTGRWMKVRTITTRSLADTRIVDLPKGIYRAVAPTQHSHPTGTSSPVRIAR